MFQIPGEVKSAGNVQGAPEVKAEFVVKGRACHVDPSTREAGNFSVA
jgi:hypothetical protein